MLLRFRSSIGPVIATLVFAFGLWKTAPARIHELKSSYNLFSPPPLSQLSSPVINLLTLGHFGIYEDFINIWLLQTLLDPRKGQDPEPMMNMIRSVVKHHPKLETTYMLSCFVMFQDFKKPEYCQEIILAGLKAFPTSWRLPMTQGYVEYFLLKQPAQSASFFMMAASRPQSPEYVKKTVQKLLKENTLSPADLQKSLDIISESESSDAFVKLLKALGKLNDSLPETPASTP